MPQGGGGQPQSMSQGLQKILGELAQLKLAPDADMQLLMGLEQAIIQSVQQKSQQQGQPGQPGQPGGQPGQGGGGPQGLPPMNPQTGGGPSMGLGSQLPNPDELRRMLGATGASQ